MPSGMKKVFITPLTDISSTDKEGIGTIRFEGNKIYKYIQYDEATAAVDGVAGEVTYYIADSGYGASNVTSDLSASGSAGTEVAAGVLQAALTDEDYGWIQIKGLATLTIALTAGADGNSLTPTGAGDGTLDVVITTVSLSHNGCAYAIDVTAKEILCDFPF